MPLALEVTETQYNLYAGLLVVAGAALLALALTGWGTPSTGARAINGLIGAGFAGYGVYLLFFNASGEFYLFYYVFILPVLLIFQAFRNSRAKKTEQADSQP